MAVISWIDLLSDTKPLAYTTSGSAVKQHTDHLHTRMQPGTRRQHFLYVFRNFLPGSMRPLSVSEMLMSTREVILAAFRSLMKGPSFLHNFLSIWFAHSDSNERERRSPHVAEVKRLFAAAVRPDALLHLSAALQNQFKQSLESNMRCMLPSYNHQLPTGQEKGTYLALDVGGSTFRVALIELGGKDSEKPARILSLQSWKIGNETKRLRGHAFFDWMAANIEETVLEGMGDIKVNSTLSMGLAWSFPIEQTSLRGGLLQDMGKGFLVAQDLMGQDLGDLIQSACSRRNLEVKLEAIVNDSSATLLSKAYEDPTTRFALILGTGVNAAVHLPVHSFGACKFGTRPSSWHAEAKHVVVNTELSLFGAGLLPFTRWDQQLNDGHSRPDFQPFEHFVSGRYLGELVRLVLLENIRSTDLFSGVVPPSLLEQYSLETETLSRLKESNDALRFFLSKHPSPAAVRESDIDFVRLVAALVSRRAAALLAAGVHALWQLRNAAEMVSEAEAPRMVVSYAGSVLEYYPGFREECQGYLDGLVGHKGLELRAATESSLLGAAVAVACVDI